MCKFSALLMSVELMRYLVVRPSVNNSCKQLTHLVDYSVRVLVLGSYCICNFGYHGKGYGPKFCMCLKRSKYGPVKMPLGPERGHNKNKYVSLVPSLPKECVLNNY